MDQVILMEASSLNINRPPRKDKLEQERISMDKAIQQRIWGDNDVERKIQGDRPGTLKVQNVVSQEYIRLVYGSLGQMATGSPRVSQKRLIIRKLYIDGFKELPMVGDQ